MTYDREDREVAAGAAPKMPADGAMQHGDWYVAATLPRKEAFAISNLKQQKFATFFPRMAKRAGKVGTGMSPLFPGYVFVRFDRSRDRWQAINGTYGVRRLISSNDRHPSIVPPHFMKELMARCPSEVWQRSRLSLERGQPVKIASGPLVGIMANFEEYISNDRVKILMNFLNCQVTAIVSRDHLR